MKLFVTAAVTLATVASSYAVAHADASVTDQDAAEKATSDGRAEFTGGAMLGGTNAAIDAAFVAEGTYRIDPTMPFYVRGRAAMGEADDFSFEETNTSSPMLQVLGGIEARGCLGDGILCPLVGMNAGYESQGTLGDSMTTHAGPLGGIDFGLDVGGDKVRARLVLDLFAQDDSGRWASGGDLSFGVGARF